MCVWENRNRNRNYFAIYKVSIDLNYAGFVTSVGSSGLFNRDYFPTIAFRVFFINIY